MKYPSIVDHICNTSAQANIKNPRSIVDKVDKVVEGIGKDRKSVV